MPTQDRGFTGLIRSRVTTALLVLSWTALYPCCAPAQAPVADQTGCAGYKARGDYEGATECYRQWLVSHPFDSSAWTELAMCHSQLRNHAEAVECYTRALAAGSTSASIFRRRGLAQFALHRFESADSDLTRAIRLSPDDGKLLLERGNMRFMTGRFRDALQDLEAADALGARNRFRIWLDRLIRQVEGGPGLPPPTWKPDLDSYRSDLAITPLTEGGFLIDLPVDPDPPSGRPGSLVNTFGYADTRQSFGGSLQEPLWYAPSVRVWEGSLIHDRTWGVLLEDGTHFCYQRAESDTAAMTFEGVVEGWRFVVRDSARELISR